LAIDKKQVSAAILLKRKAVVWDNESKGFGVRIYPSGAASWVVVKRLGAGGRGSKLVWHVVGSYSALTYKEAKKKARSKLNEISEGSDPSEKKRKDRIKGLEVYKSGKLEDVVSRYFQKNAKHGRYWKELRQRFDRQIIPTIGATTLVANITKHELRVLLDNKEKETQSGARLTFAALSPFFKWCVSHEIIQSNPLASLLAPETQENRERVLTNDELIRIWEAADYTAYPWGPFYKLLLLTLQRRDEVAGMQWCELDHRSREWIIPGSRTKNGKEHLVHLSPMAWEIVDNLAKNAPKMLEGRFASPFVFPATDATYITGYSKAKTALDETIKEIFGDELEPWRVHDLRRTGATGLAMLKVSPHVIERVLNHITGSATAKVSGIDAALVRVYQRFQYAKERKEALLKWSDYLSDLITKKIQTPERSLLLLPASR
jgi:integrase